MSHIIPRFTRFFSKIKIRYQAEKFIYIHVLALFISTHVGMPTRAKLEMMPYTQPTDKVLKRSGFPTLPHFIFGP